MGPGDRRARALYKDRMPARSSSFIPILALLFGGCLCAGEPGNLVPETVADDPTLPAIDINGTRLHAEAFGNPDGPVLLVLHGGPGVDYRSMLPLRALADDGYRVVFWDQRGAGLSARVSPDTIDLDVYLEDLRQMIERYAPTQPVVLIGHSWGSMYATAFIDRYGDYGGRIRGAVHSEPGGFTLAQLNAFLDRYIASMSLTGEQLNDAMWTGKFISAADHERADYMQMLFSMRGVPSEHKDPKNPSPSWRCGAAVSKRMLEIAQEGFDWTKNLGAFQHEVLFLRGDLNTAATAEQQQELAAAYPMSHIITMNHVGHEMIWEQPDEYIAHVRTYLQSIGVTP
jgi:proline iminopeptidase